MMKKTRLDELLNYYKYTRQKGHTTLMVDGLHSGRKAVFLFASNGHAEAAFRQAVERYHVDKAMFADRKIGGIRFETIGWLNNLEENLRGRSFENLPAVVIDHFALEILVNEHFEKLMKEFEKNANN